MEQARRIAGSYPVWTAEVVRRWHEMSALEQPLMADDVLKQIERALDSLHLAHEASWNLIFSSHHDCSEIITACLPPEITTELGDGWLSPLMGLYHVCHPAISLPGDSQVADAILQLTPAS